MVKMIQAAMILSLLILLQGSARADSFDFIQQLPSMKQGLAYSIEDHAFNYLSTAEIIKWKGFALEAGYAGRAKETGDKIVGVLSYQLARLKDYGVTLPILDLVEFNVGAYAGYGRVQITGDKSNDNEFDYGVALTLLNVKF